MDKKYMIKMDFGCKIPLNYEVVAADKELSLEITKIIKKPCRVVMKGQNFTLQIGSKEYEGRLMTIYTEKKKYYIKKDEEFIEFKL